MNKLKELWGEFMLFHEDVMWKNSPDRKQLAVDRITALRAYTSGESDVNPYADLYDKT